MWGAGNILFTIVYTCILSVSFIGNLLIIVIIIRSKQLRQRNTNLLIFNLAISDLLVATINVPYNISVLIGATKDIFTCKLAVFVAVLCFTVAQFNLLLITVDRYLGINHPLKYRARITTKKTISAIVIAWIISNVVAAFPVIHRPDPSSLVKRNTKICLLADLLAPITLSCFLMVVFYLPVLITIVLYLRILTTIARARDSNIRTSSTCRNQSSSSKKGLAKTENNGQPPHSKCKRIANICKHEIKSAKIVLVQIALYVGCMLPITIYDMYVSFSQDLTNSDVITQMLLLLAYCSSAINPFLYGIRDPKYRKAIKDLFHCM
ncbi:D(1A) dopamine receptor-like [Clytia hemisphaerica]|uniref:D(1A) dopamine receptor-like n=1 Tax=Clytia hemisphaerica TaxID=252671 RepID=UPI0034D5824A